LYIRYHFDTAYKLTINSTLELPQSSGQFYGKLEISEVILNKSCFGSVRRCGFHILVTLSSYLLNVHQK